MNISKFKGISPVNPESISLENALDLICDGTLEPVISSLRNEPDKDKQSALKNQLPSVTFSAIFTNYRATKNTEKYQGKIEYKPTGIAVIEYDHLESINHACILRDQLFEEYEIIIAAFISPRGKGVKTLIRIPVVENDKAYDQYFDELMSTFKEHNPDPGNFGIGRLLFLSHDKQLRQRDYEKTQIYHLKNIPNSQPVNKKATDKKIELRTPEQKYLREVMIKAFDNIPEDERHPHLIKKATWLGGHVPEYITEEWANNLLNTIISTDSKYDKIESRRQTIKDCIKHGMENPLKIEDNGFWYNISNGKVGFDTDKMMIFLTKNGIFRYYTTQIDYIFVQKTNNIVEQIDLPKIKRLLMDYVILNSDVKTKRAFERSINILTSTPNMMLLDAIVIPFFMDRRDEAHFFYENGIIEILKDKDEVNIILYENFSQPIWKSMIIPRPLPLYREGEGEFLKFMKNVFKNEESFRLIRQSIGYLLHSNRNRAFTPAIILSDDNISDNSQGGTGKGIIVQALNFFMKTTREDGKTFDPGRVFSYQNIDLDTKLFFIDDAKKGFSLETLFSIITEGFIIEKKNKQRLQIPFERSPKIIINTNYAIKGDGESHKRRRVDIVLDDYYNSNFTPLDDFDHMLFDDWTPEEWVYFDMFMLESVQIYIDTGLQRISNSNLIKKQLKLETHPDFEDWLSRLSFDTWYPKNELLESWIKEITFNGKFKFTKTRLTSWITKYESILNFKLENDRKADKYMLKSTQSH